MRRLPARTALASAAATVCGMLLSMAPGQAQAADCTWNAGAGNWSAFANWLACVGGNGSPGNTPGSADTANIGAAGVVTVNTAQSVNSLNNAGRVNIDAAQLALGGGGSTNSGTINVGGAGTAALQMNGALNNTGGVINVGDGSVLNQLSGALKGGTITTSGSGRLAASNNAGNVLDGVTLNGTLDLASGNARERIVNGITLNGVVNIANGGILSLDSAGGAASQTIGGTATINLNDAGARLAIDGTGSTTLGAGITVRGQGNIGIPINTGGNNVLTNNGLISADVNGGTLSITAPASGGGSRVINNGTLQAVNGGTLLLATDITSNSGSQIVSGAGSSVVQQGARLNGVITVNGSGSFQVSNSAANVLDGVNFTGTLDLATPANSRERIVNGATLNGAVNIGNGGILSLDSAAGAASQTIGGTATITLKDAGARLAIDGTGSTTLGAGITVHGQGNIGTALNTGGNNVLTNNGLISADVNGGTLSITAPASGGGSRVINNGTLQAVNGGTLLLATDITSNSGSQIVAGAGSTVVQQGVKLNGVISVNGTGSFQVNNSAANFLDGVNFTGTLDMATPANSRQRIINGATLNGTVNIANGGILSLDSAAGAASQTIAGTATINLNDAGARLAIDGTGSTTLGAGITVRGQGNIGTAINSGGNNVLTNNGLISADVSGGTLTIAAPASGGGSSFVNNGTLRAVNGSTLVLSTDILSNPGGQIVAGAASTVVQNGVTLNGVLTTSGSGVFTTSNSAANFLNGVAFSGTLDMAAAANSRERIVNGATINGAVNIANGGILSLDSTNTAGGNQTLGGTAVINLNDAGARLAIDGTGTTTLGSGVTVRGQGGIGAALNTGGNNTLVNNGLISADVAGGTLTITPPASGGGSSLVNNSTLQAVGGGTLVLSTNVNNAAGQILAQAGSTVLQSGVTISGGTLAGNGGGVFQVSSNGANVLNGVTMNGTVDMSGAVNSRERIANGATINGTVTVANGGILSLDGTASGGGNVNLAGTGVIHLNDAGARLSIEGTGTTTLGAGLTVRGQGNIGTALIAGGNNTLFNNGTILADGGTLTISAPASGGASALAGTGTLQVGGGALNLNTGNASTQGRLVIGATGTLNLNAQNLTITSDYTNAQSGVGNAFDRRAGVSGTGQILAGGDAAQAVTGASISNGATANATLTIGNLRVGANTFNYQVANTGTTGPVLRGAVQTAVNGGNITDARLSGSGVTASNYTAGGPGGSTGSLNVVFNAASAGTLAPLTGQAVNLSSNFDNIGNQKLNIVLAAGAAAYNAAVGAATPTPVVVANQRVGGSASQVLTVQNTAAAGAFSEDLNAGFSASTGAATTNGGSVAALRAGSSNAGAMSVGVDTTSAGAKSGTVTLNYQTNGTVNGVSNGLGVGGANAPQTISVSGNVYQAASGAIQTPALSFGNVQVGQTVTQNLVIRNTAGGPAGFVEDLNASFATGVGTDARITGTGSLSGILAGQNSGAGNGTMTVAINTASAGSVNGTIRVNYATAGAVNGVGNGLGTAGAGSEDYAASGTVVVGTVIDQAKAVINGVANPGPVTVNLGNVRVGGTAGQTLNVLNQATGGPQAALNASITSNGGPVTAGGSFSGLLAGNSSPGQAGIGTLRVGVDTSAAGARSGTATVSLVSDITAFGDCSPCTLALPSQTVNVNANVFRLAAGSASPTAVDLGAFRVGINAPAGATRAVTNTAAADGFSEQLGVGSVSSGNAQFTASNSLGTTRVNAGQSAANAITIGAGAGLAAGVNTGTVTVQYVSDGTASGTGGAINVNSQVLAVTAKGYTAAVGQLSAPAVIDFGTVRVGTSLGTQTVTISNVAASTALNDTLQGTVTVAGSGFTGSGASASGLVAGGAGAALQLGLDTSTAGVKSGSAKVAYVSQNPDMADLALGDSAAVALSGTVNALADPLFSRTAGGASFICAGGVCTLNLGTLLQGSGTSTDTLRLANAAGGPADDLLGGFDFSGFGSFGESGFGAVDLGAGAALDGLTLSLDTTAIGDFVSSFTFNGLSHNAFQSDYVLAPIRFVVEGSVVAAGGGGGGDVPEPGTLWLLLAAAAGGWAATRRRQVH